MNFFTIPFTQPNCEGNGTWAAYIPGGVNGTNGGPEDVCIPFDGGLALPGNLNLNFSLMWGIVSCGATSNGVGRVVGEAHSAAAWLLLSVLLWTILSVD